MWVYFFGKETGLSIGLLNVERVADDDSRFRPLAYEVKVIIIIIYGKGRRDTVYFNLFLL